MNIIYLGILVPKPRVNLTRFHGVIAPNGLHRTQVTLVMRGKGGPMTATGRKRTLISLNFW